MKKFAYLLFCMTALSACAGLEEEAQKEVASFTQVPVSAAGQQVRIVVQKPADNCTFKGGIMGGRKPQCFRRIARGGGFVCPGFGRFAQ